MLKDKKVNILNAEVRKLESSYCRLIKMYVKLSCIHIVCDYALYMLC